MRKRAGTRVRPRRPGTSPLRTRKQVHAREPGPLAVRLEQLGGLPALDPAAPELAQQLHEAEVADEPVLAPPEALEADDADRPRAEPALALEASDDGRGRQLVQPLEVDGAADAHERGAAARMQPERPQLRRRERASSGAVGAACRSPTGGGPRG